MSLAGKTVLITGATDGVGRQVALALAADGATVLVHGRNRERAESLLAAMRERGGKGSFYPADLASLAGTRALAAAVARDHARLDLLISNAGIGSAGDGSREVSADGHELRFAVNYLAGFLLTRLLLPQLRAAAPSRIRQMVIFDHVNRGSYDPNALMDAGRPFVPSPPVLSEIPHVLESAGWRVDEVEEAHGSYVKWYTVLVSRIESKRSEILALAGAAGYDHVLSLYHRMLKAAMQGCLGAAFIRATPIEA